MLFDSQKAQKLNTQLVNKLYEEKRFTDPRIGEAFLSIPRHYFLPEIELKKAYRDQAIPTKYAGPYPISSSSQPAMMAIMLEQLAVGPGHNVLEIGAGTGYNAALLRYLVGENGSVTALDIDQDIVEGARAHLEAAGVIGVEVVRADGMQGYPARAPYDRIILTVGAADIAPAWWEQLKVGGRLLLPLSLNGPQKSIAFVKRETHWESASVRDCGFMRLRGEMAPYDQQQIALVPAKENSGLELELPALRDEIEAERVFAWLKEDATIHTTGIRATGREAWGSLSLWLATREPQACRLVAAGEWAGWEAMPVLFDYRAAEKAYAFTHGLLEEEGLAALVRLHPNEHDKTFEIGIRSFGQTDQSARRLAEHVESWDAAGRPLSDQLHICAYPADAEITLREGETLLEKHFTQLVISWIA